MELVWDAGYLVIGLVLLFLGGEGLVRGATSIATRFGLSRLIVGLVIVGFGTSAPELLVSIQAALAGSPDISAGNVVGSNIANVLLIIGVAAAIAPLANSDPSIRRDLIVMVAASVLLEGLFLLGMIDRLGGLLLFAAFALYLTASYLIERKRQAGGPGDDHASDPPMGTLKAALGVLIGIAMLVFGAHFLVEGATGIARDVGISEAVIGLTIVALGTSLPELATAIVASRKNEAEVVLANIVGSSIFNILCILGITALIEPITIADRFARADGPIMVAVAVAAAIYLFTCRQINRVTGLALVGLYAVYMGVQNMI